MAYANITGQSIGQDLRLVVFQPVSQAATPVSASFTDTALGRLISLNAMPVIQETSSVPLTNGGIRIVRNIYQGWNGDMDFVRYNGNLSGLMAGIMGTFNSLGTETYFNIDVLVFNVITGSTDTYTFVNCVLSQVNIGNFGELSRVDQRLHFEGQNMLFNGQPLSALPIIGNIPGSGSSISGP